MTLDRVLTQETGGIRAPAAVLAVRHPDGDIQVIGANTSKETLFGIGSVTKVITATLIMQHVQRGSIKLDDRISIYLPGFEVSPPSATGSITIQHLLTHTSGVDCSDAFIDTGDGADCMRNFVRDVASGSSLLHSPGDFWSYSNGGYSLLGRLIEILEGKSWEDAVIARIFSPLGLKATFATRIGPDDPLAIGHRFDSGLGAIVEEPGWLPSSAGPAGSNLVATADDLVTFAQALLGGEGVLLDPALALEMAKPVAISNMKRQGLAWEVSKPGVLSHYGTTKGSSAHLECGPNGRIISLLANGPGASMIAAAVLTQIEGESTSSVAENPEDQEEEAANQIEVVACVGWYKRRFAEHRIFLKDGGLMAETVYSGPLADILENLPPVELRRASGSTFVSKRTLDETPTTWEFYRTDPGRGFAPPRGP